MLANDDSYFILRIRSEFMDDFQRICDRCGIQPSCIKTYRPKHLPADCDISFIYIAFDRKEMFNGDRVLIDELHFWKDLNAAPFKISVVHVTKEFEDIMQRGA